MDEIISIVTIKICVIVTVLSLPTINNIKWNVDFIFSSSIIKKVNKPLVRCQLTLNNSKNSNLQTSNDNNDSHDENNDSLYDSNLSNIDFNMTNESLESFLSGI